LLFKNKLMVEKLNVDIDISKIPTIKSARLVSIIGKGILSTHTTVMNDSYYGSRCLTQIKLNAIPLVQINAPCCPTCSNILATGYGIENANCKELSDIRDVINESFISLDASVEALKPLLTLLKSGLYIIADTVCFPTDGNDAFFWNVPNEPTNNLATAGILLPEVNYTFVSGQPVYLYPTQSTDCYKEERVQHYINVFKSSGNHPRAVVYQFGEFINFIIDGHHKACAASILGKPLNCIVIIPFKGYEYHKFGNKMIPDTLQFSSIKVHKKDILDKYLPSIPKRLKYKNSPDITSGKINRRVWEKEYLDSVKNYPSTMEYVDMIAAGVPNDITDDLIACCLVNLDDENQQKMKAILFVLKYHNDLRWKQVAIACANRLPNCTLRKQAYKALCTLKNDPEVEQLFIDYLVDCNDKHDLILPIINSYWG